MTSGKSLVPEAKAALDKFKMEAASEVGVNLNNSYNGDLTSRQAGSVGGQMVKKICPVKPAKIMTFERKSRTSDGHTARIKYIIGIDI